MKKNYEKIVLTILFFLVIFNSFMIIKERNYNSSYSDNNISVKQVSNHLYQISRENHNTFSDEINQVRSYIKEHNEKLGTSYEIDYYSQTFQEFVQNYIDEISKEARKSGIKLSKENIDEQAENISKMYNIKDSKKIIEHQSILVKIDQKNTEDAILLMAHYDNANIGTGAGDDGLAVASLLETIRVLKNNKENKNDVYILFTDDEETTGEGASRFIKNNKDLKNNIKLVINFEARGVSGSTLMFESSKNNYNLIKNYLKGSTYSTVFSFATAVYGHMPNSSDLSKFLDAGYNGLNFAVLGKPYAYHTVDDSFDNVKLKTINEYAKTTYDMAIYFSNIDLNSLTSDDQATVFNFVPGKVIFLSQKLVNIFSLIIIFLSMLWTINLKKLKKYTAKEFLETFKNIWLITLKNGIFAFLTTIIPTIFWLIIVIGEYPSNKLITILIELLFIFQLILISKFTLKGLIKRIKSKEAYISNLTLGYIIFTILTLLFLQGGVYLFSIPLALITLYSIYETYLMRSCLNSIIAKSIFIIVFGVVVIPFILLLFLCLLMSLPIMVLPLLCMLVSFFFMTIYILHKND